MPWLTLITGLAKIVSVGMRLLERKQLIDAGSAMKGKANADLVLSNLNKVRRARRDPAKRDGMRERRGRSR